MIYVSFNKATRRIKREKRRDIFLFKIVYI